MDEGLNFVHDSPPRSRTESFTTLQRIAEGDKSALEDCLAAYDKLLWNLARKFTKTKEDAEDAVQEIFIDIWRSAARFDAKKCPERAFVIMVARRRLIDSLRKSYRRPHQESFNENVLDNLSGSNSSGGNSGDHHDRFLLRIDTKRAVAALDQLSAREKQIIRLSVYHGISHGEIARTVGLPLGTVKSHIRRGLQKIRDRMEYRAPKRQSFKCAGLKKG